MIRSPYPYHRHSFTRYTFVSKGQTGEIIKVVQFTPTSVKNISNLSFGDLKKDGAVDDAVNSNNHDIIKVMATIIAIVYEFTGKYPYIKIVFAGNSRQRMILYFRILRTYADVLGSIYIVTALIKVADGFAEVPFQDYGEDRYIAFFLKRKS